MREILFRGKRVDNGEWVEGYLFKTRYTTINNCGLMPMIQVINTKNLYYESFEVDPKSVGQFTGILDKNGKRIFEGDVLESYLGKTRMSGVIKWENDSWGWTQFRPLSTFEIIGNIHDNPELLTK